MSYGSLPGCFLGMMRIATGMYLHLETRELSLGGLNIPEVVLHGGLTFSKIWLTKEFWILFQSWIWSANGFALQLS